MTELAAYTTLREQQLAEAATGSERVTPPPYHIYDVDMLYLLCRFDLELAKKVLPPPLEPTDEGLGVIMVLSAPRGWVIAPFTACVTTLQVKGLDGPDKYPANYVHTAFYSGVCGQMFRRFFNDRVTEGSSQMRFDGDLIEAGAGRDGADTIRISARRTRRVTDEVVGVNKYLASFGNTILDSSTSYSAHFEELEDVRIDVLDTAPEPLRSLRPLEVVWPLYIEGMSLTFNSARPLGASETMVPAEAALASIFELLVRFRKAAAVVGQSGRPLFVTPEATQLLGDGYRSVLSTPRLLSNRGDNGRRLGEPIVLEHSTGRPILAQIVPLLHGLGDEPLKLILLADPTGSGRGDPEPVLQLMGLTPAEARLAARVGRGLSPNEAADEIGITVQTARSSLKAIFTKLDLSRQAQLAQTVARLEEF